VRIDDVVATPSEGATTAGGWIPPRAELGVRAFGLSAYVGDAGEVVVPRHQETGGGPGGHEEVYVFVRGRATFELDGRAVDAPPASCVFVGRVRHARRAPRDEPYRIAPWEYGSRAARVQQLGRIDELDAVVREGATRYGDHVTMLVGNACVAAQHGDHDRALDLLERAVRDEDFGDWARTEAAAEPLLDPVRNDPRFPR
jgi:hypothetical protein